MSSEATARVDVNAYDAVPYESFAYPLTFTSHLSVIAELFGLMPPDPKTARVLELGCAAGGNLAPQALLYPDAEFVGIDYSQEQISQAEKLKQELKLKNIEFVTQNILNFNPPGKDRKFDYIICHGMMSWVPEPVRNKILDICRDWLSEDGIAVISYNTLPGWHPIRAMRDMMLYHTRRFEPPALKVEQGRVLLDFLSENIPLAKVGYRDTINNEISILKDVNNTYLYHDHLENTNVQFYLHEFVDMARSRQLEYLGDTMLPTMYVEGMPEKSKETLRAIPDLVEQEQYMDFISNRRFRSTVLSKQSRKVNRNVPKEKILDFFLSINSQIEVDGLDPKRSITFKMKEGSFVTNNEVAGVLFLELLSLKHLPISAEDLIARAQKKLNLKDAKPVRDVLVANGIHLVFLGAINLHADIYHVTTVSEKPVAFAMARYQAAQPGCKSTLNTQGNLIALDGTSNLIMRHLDGTRTLEDLADVVQENVKKGVLTMAREGIPLKDEKEIHESAVQLVNMTLAELVKYALLVG